MIIKWRWVEAKNRCWYNNLIGYSKTKKDHVYMLNEALKILQRKECVRIIVENADLEK